MIEKAGAIIAPAFIVPLLLLEVMVVEAWRKLLPLLNITIILAARVCIVCVFILTVCASLWAFLP
jgi:hypothetical protein